MILHTDILTIVYHYCDNPTKFKLRLLSNETHGKIDYVFYDDKWFRMGRIKINNDTAKIKKVKYVEHLDQLKLFPYMTNLIFHWKFNLEIKDNVLPKSLTHLTFDWCFNQEIKAKVLPSSLTHLTFGFWFNQKIKIDVLPSSLNHLTFDWYFNQEININVLPSSLTHLTFGCWFNKKININVLPSSLTHLTFSKNYKYKDQIKENYPNVNIKFV